MTSGSRIAALTSRSSSSDPAPVEADLQPRAPARRAPRRRRGRRRASQRGQRHAAVHRPGVEVGEAELGRDGAGDGGLAGPGGAVDRDDHGGSVGAVTAAGAARVRRAEQRGEVGLEAGVADRGRLHPVDLDALARGEAGDGAEHRDPVVAVGVDRAAAQAAGARRSTIPSSVGSTWPPSAVRAAATVSIRSDSLRRSSAASRIVVVPSAKQAASATSGSSSIASGTSAPPTSVPRSAPRRDAQVARSARRRARRSARPRSSAPIRSRIASRPVRVGLMPTSSSTTSLPGTSSAATSEEGGRGEVGGDDDRGPARGARPGAIDDRVAVGALDPRRRRRPASARCGRGSAAARSPRSRPRPAGRRRAGRT